LPASALDAGGAIKPRPSVRNRVTDDATLSDFEGPTDDADGDGTAGDAADESLERDDGDDAPAPRSNETGPADVARSTYAWGEYACADCGTATERVWREDESFVCPACKSW
jgi:hypothetical protein